MPLSDFPELFTEDLIFKKAMYIQVLFKPVGTLNALYMVPVDVLVTLEVLSQDHHSVYEPASWHQTVHLKHWYKTIFSITPTVFESQPTVYHDKRQSCLPWYVHFGGK